MRKASFAVGVALSAALTTPVLAAASGPSAQGGGAGFFADDSPVFAGERVQLDLAAQSDSGRFTAVHHTSSGVFTRLSGSIDCLIVSGDVAIATGVITAGVAGIGVDPVGTRVSFRITDGNPDVFDVDLAFFSGHVIAPCTSDPILTWSVEQGNFSIRE